MIKPTVGRVVWFHPSVHESPLPRIGDQPFAAIITGVWGDSCVNLAFFDANGIAHNACSVPLVQDDGVAPGSYYCEWMPYQKGQAAKTEALEAQVGQGQAAA